MTTTNPADNPDLPMFRMLAVLTALTIASPAWAQSTQEVDARIDTVLGDHVPYEAAYVDLVAALEADDPETLSELMIYGAPFSFNGKQVTLKDAAEFEARFRDFFTDEVKKVVLAQTYETLFVNADGVMFGTGQLWLSGVCDDDACMTSQVKIIAINNG